MIHICYFSGKPRGKQAAYEQFAAFFASGFSTLTEVLHALGEQRLERVKTVGLGVHALGQGVAQVHFVLKQQARRRRAAGRVGAVGLVALRLHVRVVAVARAWRRRVTLSGIREMRKSLVSLFGGF